MNRKQFIKKCGYACIGAGLGVTFLNSCTPMKSVVGEIIDSDLVVPLQVFLTGKGANDYRKFVLIENPQLKLPICVFRLGEKEYTSLLMQCTHQGAELQVFGDRLQCPAHGSEFDNKGHVQNGPADSQLRSFPTTIINNQIKISLKNA